MQLVVQGEFTDVRKSMKVFRQEKAKIRSKLEKELKERTKKHQPIDNLKNRIGHIERQINIYTFTKTHPVRIENIIVNGKLLQEFLKKIKDFQIIVTVEEGSLCLHYSKSIGNVGKLVLYDISSYFPEIPNIPTAVLKDENL